MNERKSKATISQVAKEAGVAKSSVSRAYTKPHLLSQDTVERIKEAARRLGYTPNHTARALSTGSYRNIALIIPDVANPFFPPMIRAAQMEAERSNYCVFLGNSDEEAGKEDRLLERFSGQVEGIILASPRLSNERIAASAELCATVLINRDVSKIPRILIDSGNGIREAVQHLAERGHKRIVYVSGPSSSWSNTQRRMAIKEATASVGVHVDYLSSATPSVEAGIDAVEAILATSASATVAFDDVTAQGIVSGLSSRGISIPDQHAVVGCDDALGPYSYPPLTTISSQSAEAGRLAVSLLLQLLDSESLGDARYVLDTHLIVRGTT